MGSATELLASRGGGRIVCRRLTGVPAEERGVLALADGEDGKWIRPWEKESVKHGCAIDSRPRRSSPEAVEDAGDFE